MLAFTGLICNNIDLATSNSCHSSIHCMLISNVKHQLRVLFYVGLQPTDDSYTKSNGGVISNQFKTGLSKQKKNLKYRYHACIFIEKTFSCDDPPDLEVLENVIVQIRRKWWMIGENLGLKSNELDAFQKQPDDKSLRNVLECWTDTPRKPYTWDTFLTALRSNEVDMKEVADDIESKHIIYTFL